MYPWNEYRVNYLKEMWELDLSAREIAADLHRIARVETTRNAVIAMANRLIAKGELKPRPQQKRGQKCTRDLSTRDGQPLGTTISRPRKGRECMCLYICDYCYGINTSPPRDPTIRGMVNVKT